MINRGEDGFTLVEVLVAFVILSGAIILSFQIFSDGLRRLTGVELRMRQVNIARAELEKVSASGAIFEGVQIGTTDGVSWKISIKNLADASIYNPLQVQPFKVVVDVIDPDGKGNATPIIETIILGYPAKP
jgi:general secretion pathway protein I